MPNFDRPILIQNINKLMDSKKMTQKQLGDVLHMSQPNVCKALNPKEKKCFTLEQVVNIAAYFHVSIDSLIAGDGGHSSIKLTPRSIARFIVNLVEHQYAKVERVEVEEEMFKPFIDHEGIPDFHHKKAINNYAAFYLPSYTQIEDYVDVPEEAIGSIYNMFEMAGNDTAMRPVNSFLKDYLRVRKLYLEHKLPEDTYTEIINNFLNKLYDK